MEGKGGEIVTVEDGEVETDGWVDFVGGGGKG